MLNRSYKIRILLEQSYKKKSFMDEKRRKKSTIVSAITSYLHLDIKTMHACQLPNIAV
jgi:hypothetical protein